jgi:hypothetical protein
MALAMSFFRDRLAMRVIGAAADEAAIGLEFGDALGVEPGDDRFDFFHHLRADAVAGGSRNRL